jgi:hypothetical protein
MRDQRATKTGKQPDFVCVSGCVNEKGYPVGAWLPKPKPAPMAASSPSLPLIRPPKWTWATLTQTYQQSMIVARKSVVGMATALKLEVRMEDILSATATIFICATRDGVKQPQPEPEKETVEV